MSMQCKPIKLGGSYESRCRAGVAPGTEPTDTTRNSAGRDDNRLLVKLSAIVCVALLLAVALNVVCTVLLKRVFRRKAVEESAVRWATRGEAADDVTPRPSQPRQALYGRHRPEMIRQHTAISHAYETIRDDDESSDRDSDVTGSFVVSVHEDAPTVDASVHYDQTPSNVSVNMGADSGPPGATNLAYMDMNGSRDRFAYTSMRGTRESSLDALVLPAEYSDHARVNPHRNSAMYSYAYDSRENVNMQSWPRKYSAESLDSAAALLRKNPRFRDLVVNDLASAGGSFDSGYAERATVTSQLGDDEMDDEISGKSTSDVAGVKVDAGSRAASNREDYIDVENITPSHQMRNTGSETHAARNGVDDDYENIVESDDENSGLTSAAEVSPPAAAASLNQAPTAEVPGYVALF